MAKQHVVSVARDFAVQAHRAHPANGQSFMLHLDEVAVLVRDFGDTHQTVAYLQHVLQDGLVTLAQVEHTFGALVARCVALLTAEPDDDPKRSRRLAYAKLAKVTVDDDRVVALVVKAAERLAEVQECYLNEDRGQLRKFRRDHRDFRTAVFRPGVADDLWNELNTYSVV